MAVAYNKYYIFAALLAFSNLAYGNDSLINTHKTPFDISLERYESAKLKLETAMEECSKNRAPVPLKIFDKIEKNIEDIKTALFVLNDRAEVNCEKETREHFFFTAAIHRQVAKYFDKHAGSALDYNEESLLSHYGQKMEFEAKYLLLDKNVRKYLENINELKTPFLVFETIDILNKKQD